MQEASRHAAFNHVHDPVEKQSHAAWDKHAPVRVDLVTGSSDCLSNGPEARCRKDMTVSMGRRIG